MQDLTHESLQILWRILPWALPLYLIVAWLCLKNRKRIAPPLEVTGTWTGLHILLAFLATYLFWNIIGLTAVDALGVGKKNYPEDLVVSVKKLEVANAIDDHLATLGGGSASFVRSREVKMTQFRLSLWASALIFPLQLLTIPMVLRLGNAGQPADMGLRSDRLASNLGLGVLLWLVVAPPVLVANLLFQVWYVEAVPGGPEMHPFVELCDAGLSPTELTLVILLAMIVAPCLEETLFRGLIQPWSVHHSWRRWVLLLIVLVMVIFRMIGQLLDQWEASFVAVVDLLSPLLFLALIALVMWGMEKKAVSPRWSAIVATSALFAFVHLAQWPSPIALFGLALGFGWLMSRTGSLVGPILAHSLFNGIACAQMLIKYQ